MTGSSDNNHTDKNGLDKIFQEMDNDIGDGFMQNDLPPNDINNGVMQNDVNSGIMQNDINTDLPPNDNEGDMLFNQFIKVENGEESYHTPMQDTNEVIESNQNVSSTNNGNGSNENGVSSSQNNNTQGNISEQLSYENYEQKIFEDFLKQNSDDLSPLNMNSFFEKETKPSLQSVGNGNGNGNGHLSEHSMKQSVEHSRQHSNGFHQNSNININYNDQSKLSPTAQLNNNTTPSAQFKNMNIDLNMLLNSPNLAHLKAEFQDYLMNLSNGNSPLMMNNSPQIINNSPQIINNSPQIMANNSPQMMMANNSPQIMMANRTNNGFGQPPLLQDQQHGTTNQPSNVTQNTYHNNNLNNNIDSNTVKIYKEQCAEMIKSLEFGRTTEIHPIDPYQQKQEQVDFSNTGNSNFAENYPFEFSVSPLPEKSRVETQVKISFKVTPSPPLNILHISNDCITKQKQLLKQDISTYPEQLRKQILYLDAQVVCATKNKPVGVCARCLKREQRRSSRRKSGTSDINLWCNNENRKIIVFNNKQLTLLHSPKDTASTNNTSTTSVNSIHDNSNNGNTDYKSFDLSARLVCYCRHHQEPVGFKVVFVLKNYTGQIVAKTVSTVIKLIDKEPTKRKANGSISDASFSTTSDDTSSVATGDRRSSYESVGSSVSESESGFNETNTNFNGMNPIKLDTTTADLLQQHSPSLNNSNLNLVGMNLQNSSTNMQFNNIAATLSRKNNNQLGHDHLSNGSSSIASKFSNNMKFETTIPSPSDYSSDANASGNYAQGQHQGLFLPSSVGKSARNNIYQANGFQPQQTGYQYQQQQQQHFQQQNIHQQQQQQQQNFHQHSQQQQQPFSLPNASPNGQVFDMDMLNAVNVLPTIQKIIPAEGPITGGVEVTILGANFKSGMCVKFGNNRALSASCWNGNTLTAFSPPASTPGPVMVSVFNEEDEMLSDQMLETNANPNAVFTYTDETDKKLIELALQIVGLNMNGKVENASNIAKRIVGDSETPNQSQPNNSQYSQYQHNSNQNLVAKVIKLVNNTTTNVSLCNKQGQTLLHLACLKSYIELILVLIKRGCRVEITDKYGYTPLHFACLTGDIRVLKILLTCKADPCSPISTRELLTPIELYTANHNASTTPNYQAILALLTPAANRKGSLSSLDSDILDSDSIYSNGSGFQVHISKMISDHLSEDEGDGEDDEDEGNYSLDDSECEEDLHITQNNPSLSQSIATEGEDNAVVKAQEQQQQQESSSTEDQHSTQSTESLPPQYEDLYPHKDKSFFDQEPHDFSLLNSKKLHALITLPVTPSSLPATPLTPVASDDEEQTDMENIRNGSYTLNIAGDETEASIEIPGNVAKDVNAEDDDEDDEDYENMISIKFLKQKIDFSNDKMLLFFWIPFMLVMLSSFFLFKFGSTDNRVHYLSERSSERIRIWLTKIVLGNKRMQTIFKDAFKEAFQNKGELFKDVFQQTVRHSVAVSPR